MFLAPCPDSVVIRAGHIIPASGTNQLALARREPLGTHRTKKGSILSGRLRLLLAPRICLCRFPDRNFHGSKVIAHRGRGGKPVKASGKAPQAGGYFMFAIVALAESLIVFIMFETTSKNWDR
jgi:hypothetical protein